MKNIIIAQSNGMDKNGNKKYLYNFMCERENVNELFKNRIGRITKHGLNSQLNPNELKKLLNNICFYYNELPDGVMLGKMQRKLDKYKNIEPQYTITQRRYYRLLHNVKIAKSFFECEIIQIY